MCSAYLLLRNLMSIQCSSERLADVLTLRISPKTRAALEKRSNIERISIAMAARNAIDKGLKARFLRDVVDV